MYSAFTFPSDNGSTSENAVSEEANDLFVYDPKQDPLSGDAALRHEEIFDVETGRATFFKPYQKKGMSSHSTLPFDHPGRETANHPTGCDLPVRPTFLNPEKSQYCCGHPTQSNYRLDYKDIGCLVRCPHADCKGGVDDARTYKCLSCPLALPSPNRMPLECPCGVLFSFLLSASHPQYI